VFVQTVQTDCGDCVYQSYQCNGYFSCNLAFKIDIWL